MVNLLLHVSMIAWMQVNIVHEKCRQLVSLYIIMHSRKTDLVQFKKEIDKNQFRNHIHVTPISLITVSWNVRNKVNLRVWTVMDWFHACKKLGQ